VRPEQLDADAWRLNVSNGTLDLRTGRLLRHDPGALITKLAPVEHSTDARCPIWLTFLDRIMRGDVDVIAFLQRALGYALTGDVSEQVMFFLYGTGANGKSTLLNTVHAVLGDYASHTPTETLLLKRGDTIPNDLARLKGARFVTAVEAEGGRRLAEARVKQMTGGDPISARFLHGEWFDYAPEYKLFCAVNHKPSVKGTDHAIWRRIRLIPFTVTIPEHEQDRRLGDTLRGELSGVLRWMLEGCLAWQKQGLGESEAVKTATGAYREEMDMIAAFLGDCCVIDETSSASKSELYQRYEEWCAAGGEQRMTKSELGIRLVERGVEDGKSGSVRLWRGLGLLPKA